MTDTRVLAAAEQLPIPPDLVALDFATPSDWPKQNGIVETTFGAWGRRMPIGILRGGKLHKDFAFRRWTSKQDRELEEVRANSGAMSVQEFVGKVVCHMLTQLGPWQDFQGLPESERLAITNQMYLGDVMYLYVWLRIEALGQRIVFRMRCPGCKKLFKMVADLRQTDVSAVESPDTLIKSLKLKDGIEVGETLEHNILVHPPQWIAMGSVKADTTNQHDVKTQIILSSLRQIGESVHPPAPQVLDTLTKYDLEMLTRVIDDMNPGPDLTLEARCAKCGVEFKSPLEWSWSFFFDGVSLS